MERVTRIMLAAVLLITAGPAAADEPVPIDVYGHIDFPGNGPVYIQLVTRDEFENELPGQHNLVIESPQESPVPYRFDQIAPGVYMVRGFQDSNGNGELDMGLFGPKEPWLILGYKPSAFKRPNFDEHGLMIEADLNLNLTLMP